MNITVCRKAYFNACHRMHNPNWSDAKNKSVFGVCNNANYHGHNYELIVKLTGQINPETGYIMDMKILADLIKVEIEDRFDHKNLNLDCPEFAHKIASTENFALVIFSILQPLIPKEHQMAITLFETNKNYVEIRE
ncbi:6-carboxytetrahydropterin synthase [Flavobacterium circumlabens]|uniref:6-carboxy-5,6,7,8-tetrahydropterin synthase n=1 Tax=Flavobacterium circumlabens TaxID=2133765 RepID=A0A4Y7UAB0_9FLAO|nr:6-carboxytetrahydropterin synthase [Flavobacterium circumlabens]TCN55409.1 6-pyruvoyltetrahydropterin/6-carboxytetrahydropterin synthase [Flavobacterium circumlabens]TEB43171.1 6-carboxytetrahydropterin synthase [Flavobacterium circumlabens]